MDWGICGGGSGWMRMIAKRKSPKLAFLTAADAWPPLGKGAAVSQAVSLVRHARCAKYGHRFQSKSMQATAPFPKGGKAMEAIRTYGLGDLRC